MEPRRARFTLAHAGGLRSTPDKEITGDYVYGVKKFAKGHVTKSNYENAGGVEYPSFP